MLHEPFHVRLRPHGAAASACEPVLADVELHRPGRQLSFIRMSQCLAELRPLGGNAVPPVGAYRMRGVPVRGELGTHGYLHDAVSCAAEVIRESHPVEHEKNTMRV